MIGIAGRNSDGADGGQSDIVAIVILFGMVFVGAGIVLLASGMLVSGVQEESEHELTRDSALQTHDQLQQAMTSQSPQELPDDTEAVDRRVVDGGNLTVEMLGCDAIDEDLGALVFESDRGRLIYEGGALWEETEAGVTIERPPPISYDEETARIALQAVTSESNESLRGGTVMPDEDRQSELQRAVSDILVRCPTQGHTDLRISVESEYHEQWYESFQQQVDGPNVTVEHFAANQTVRATIGNATEAHSARGLRFEDVTARSYVDSGDHFGPQVTIANDGFVHENATVVLSVAGGAYTEELDLSVGPGGTDAGTLTERSWGWLRNNGVPHPNLRTGALHDYTLTLENESGDPVSTTTGSLFLNSSSPSVSIQRTDHEIRDDNSSLLVNATLRNSHSDNRTETVAFEITESSVDMSAEPATVEVPGGGTNTVTYDVNVTTLPAGSYEYVVRHRNGDETGTFTIPGDGVTLLDRVRVVEVDPAETYVSTDDRFDVTVGLANDFDTASSASVTLDVDDSSVGPVHDNGSVPAETRQNRTLGLTPTQVGMLEPGETHDYTVTVVENGEHVTFDGSFYVGEPDSALDIRDPGNQTSGDDVTLTATITNDGVENGSDTVDLRLLTEEGLVVATNQSQTYELAPGESREVSFGFNASALNGVYEYELEYDGETVNGTLEFGAIDDGNGDVTITAPGTGTVTVLGTEVSAEGYNYDYGYWQKFWVPISVSSIVNIDGDVSESQFENTEATDTSAFNDIRNLNTYDTQEATYSHNWTQVAGETATLTVRSTVWEPPRIDTSEYDYVNDRRERGQTWIDYHPPEDVWDHSDLTVDASAGNNPENVRVLLDGDQVPNVDAATEDQRSAAEVLNQGAADRVADDGTLDLGPNEAVFLFEVTDEDATWQEARESDPDEDPDYNDVIVLVGFNPDDPSQDIAFDVEDGNSLVIAPDVPDQSEEGGDQQIDEIDSSDDPGSGSTPSPADPQDPDPGEPTEPDEIEVDVGTVVIG